MRSMTKKLIITGAAAVIVLGGLTACTKTAEKTENEETAGEETAGEEMAAEENADKPGAASEEGDGASSAEETELNGRIEEVPEGSDDSFIIAKLVTEEIDGVSMISDDPEGTKITVVYSMDTRFVKRTVRDGGEKVEEAEGSEADLKKDFTVEIKGSYSNEEEKKVFFATDVKIVEVVL